MIFLWKHWTKRCIGADTEWSLLYAKEDIFAVLTLRALQNIPDAPLHLHELIFCCTHFPATLKHCSTAVCSLGVTCHFLIFSRLTENTKYSKYILYSETHTVSSKEKGWLSEFYCINITLFPSSKMGGLGITFYFSHWFFFLSAHIICAMPRKFALCLFWWVPLFLRSDIDLTRRKEGGLEYFC